MTLSATLRMLCQTPELAEPAFQQWSKQCCAEEIKPKNKWSVIPRFAGFFVHLAHLPYGTCPNDPSSIVGRRVLPTIWAPAPGNQYVTRREAIRTLRSDRSFRTVPVGECWGPWFPVLARLEGVPNEGTSTWEVLFDLPKRNSHTEGYHQLKDPPLKVRARSEYLEIGLLARERLKSNVEATVRLPIPYITLPKSQGYSQLVKDD